LQKMNNIHHENENQSNQLRRELNDVEPISLRTFTPSQAVLAKSAGSFHWTPEGKRLFDFTSGVLVANLGHNPIRWTERFASYMGWSCRSGVCPGLSKNADSDIPDGYFAAVTMTAYNGVTEVEIEASKRLRQFLQACPGGHRLEQVMWAASGSEAIQKALWATMAKDRNRSMILATRNGFHGKKGLAGAVSGSETDSERDPRVRFIAFPTKESIDVDCRDTHFDVTPFREELDRLWSQFGMKLGTLITEPYLGGGGSFHPPKAYLKMLQDFCREKDILFILDEVQANFGRTGHRFAFETYGLEPDIVVLGKGLGNGVPVAAAVGSKAIFDALTYGEGSDTWSANPLCCAAVLATLDEFTPDVLEKARAVSALIEETLVRLKDFPFIAHVRGEYRGMVWGIETRDWKGSTAAEWANRIVLEAYHGDTESNTGVHLLGPLSKKVIRVSPPLTITTSEAREGMDLLLRSISRLAPERPCNTHVVRDTVHV
jgi:4-aminobutyrate aminotransferase-like enzyme